MIQEIKYFIASFNEPELVECTCDDEKTAKAKALELSEVNEETYIIFKGTSIYYTEPPEEIPASIHKVTKP